MADPILSVRGLHVRFSLRGRILHALRGIDLDVLDPSVFPGTGTPEAGGISFDQLRKALTKVCQTVNVVALDVTELAPTLDPSGVSTAVAGKVVRELLLAINQ